MSPAGAVVAFYLKKMVSFLPLFFLKSFEFLKLPLSAFTQIDVQDHTSHPSYKLDRNWVYYPDSQLPPQTFDLWP